MAQQRLRRDDDQRLAHLADRLAAQQVEDLRRGGRHADLPVVLGGHVHEALGTGESARTLALVAVRQHHHQTRQTAPLGLAGADELVDHDLGAVHEVAELGFPDDELIGFGRRVAVFERQHGLLGQHRVEAAGSRPGRPGCVERLVAALVPALALLVVQTAWRWKKVPRPTSSPERRTP